VKANHARPLLQLPLLATAAIDTAMVVVFAASGRRSHDEHLTVLGILDTAWPFLAGAAVGWSLMYVYAHVGSPDSTGTRTFRPERVVPFGIVVWILSVAIGMTLRAVLNQGTAAAFIGVATLSLGIFLIGWRVVANRVYQMFQR